MSPISLAILFFAAGTLLVLAEIYLPSHGVLGVLGGLGLVAGVVTCFWITPFAGLSSAIALLVLAPVGAMLWVKVWPHTFAGKRLILGSTSQVAEGHAPAALVQIGQVGVVVQELRPGGTCEFGSARVEARSEHGVLPAGTRVEVVALVDRRPLVRAV